MPKIHTIPSVSLAYELFSDHLFLRQPLLIPKGLQTLLLFFIKHLDIHITVSISKATL